MSTRDHARPNPASSDGPRGSDPLSPGRSGVPGPSAASGAPSGLRGGAGAEGRTDAGVDRPAEPTLGERLVAARERKGVDLYRAERDTKIRARYLSALERGDDRELPGAVYTKGFLRNYALYLGLDPDDVLRQWRRERGDAALAAPPIAVPRPLEAPRQGLTFTPGVVAAALLTIAVVAFVGYLGLQLVRFAKPPMITVSDPAVAVVEVEEGTAEYTLRGFSDPGATVEIAAPGRDQPYRVTAGPDGSWSAVVELRRGRNEFEVSAKDPETGKVAETPVRVLINVPFSVVAAPTLTVDSPADGATYENGAVPVEGRTTNAAKVTVEATYAGPASGEPQASAAPSPSPPPGPEPQTTEPAEDGTFSVPLDLTTGRWTITVTAASAENRTVTLRRTVEVSYRGVTLVVQIKGGRAWLKVWVDDRVDPTVGAAGTVYGDGKILTFTGQRSIEVRSGSSGVTYFTLNGVSLGRLGRVGVPETWRFEPPNPPVRTDRR